MTEENAATANGYIWHKILYGGQDAYVAANYVQMDSSFIDYQSHVQNIGWQAWVSDGEMSGTSGQSLRLEAVRIELNDIDGGVEYKTHVQNIGWMDWVSDGAMSGTSGQSLRAGSDSDTADGVRRRTCTIFTTGYTCRVSVGWAGLRTGRQPARAGYWLPYRSDPNRAKWKKADRNAGQHGYSIYRRNMFRRNNSFCETIRRMFRTSVGMNWVSNGELIRYLRASLCALKPSTGPMWIVLIRRNQIQNARAGHRLDGLWVSDGTLIRPQRGSRKRLEAIQHTAHGR